MEAQGSHGPTGLLLINLGTPNGPRPADVRPYLRQFLMDPRVIDVPAWQRWMIVNLLILPFRPRQSAQAYAKIWSDRGSPLLVHGRDLQAKVQQRLEGVAAVELAMRYGRPSIRAGLDRLAKCGVERVVVFPLYPQYSSAATGSSLERVFREAAGRWNAPFLQVVPPFYDHPAFLDACAESARPHLERAEAELVFFSFHGLPERQIFKSDPTGTHCLRGDDCCSLMGAANRYCYRAQCFETARLLADRLDIPPQRRLICFQSRLGRHPWIRPYTDEVLTQRARAGCRRAAILSPAFVADCLETLEELGIRGVESFREAGGQSLEVVPCVNASDAWADAVVSIARDATSWLGPRQHAAWNAAPAVGDASRTR